MNLFAPLSGETASALAGIPGLIDGIFPLPRRFRFNLPKDIAELSRLLTSGRGERGFSYLGRPNLLSAYLRFYLPWNLYRLCRLLPGLDLELAPGDLVTDLGSGPFTLASALWISRMELRALPLEFQCVDRNGPALDAGGRFFRALAGESSPWKFRTFKGELGANRLRPAKLVCAANVFNEMYGDVSRSRGDALVRNAGKSARLLAAHADRNAAILVVEPGFPRCGEFLGLLRRALLESGHTALAPCPHDGHCPMLETPGTKRWCHFAFDTEDAPAKLKQLSLAAKLPKERAVASFLLMKRPKAATPEPPKPDAAQPIPLRVISDAFSLPAGQLGRYACSPQGLVLLAGTQADIGPAVSGMLVAALVKAGRRDAKSGALLAELAGRSVPHST